MSAAENECCLARAVGCRNLPLAHTPHERLYPFDAAGR